MPFTPDVITSSSSGSSLSLPSINMPPITNPFFQLLPQTIMTNTVSSALSAIHGHTAATLWGISAGLGIIGLAAGLGAGISIKKKKDDEEKGKPSPPPKLEPKSEEEAREDTTRYLEMAMEDPNSLVQEFHSEEEFQTLTMLLRKYQTHVALGHENWTGFGPQRFRFMMNEARKSDISLKIMTSKAVNRDSVKLLESQQSPDVRDRINKIADTAAGRDTKDDPTCKSRPALENLATPTQKMNASE